jgi:hypothetical protein
MMYASTKDFFKSHLDGISLEFQASDLEEVSEQVGPARRVWGGRRVLEWVGASNVGEMREHAAS